MEIKPNSSSGDGKVRSPSLPRITDAQIICPRTCGGTEVNLELVAHLVVEHAARKYFLQSENEKDCMNSKSSQLPMPTCIFTSRRKACFLRLIEKGDRYLRS